MYESRGEYKEVEKQNGLNQLAEELYQKLPNNEWVSIEGFQRGLNWATPKKMALGILLAQNRIQISDSLKGTRIIRKTNSI